MTLQQSLRPEQIRRILVDNMLLGPKPGLGRGDAAVEAMLEQLGYVQIDSIAVVSRAHHHTVWSRIPGYREGALYDLLARRRIFEYWGHAASFLPISDYRFSLPLMRSFREQPRVYVARSIARYRHLFKPVLQRIEKQGEMSSADFGDEHGGRKGSWWDWKPAKVVLELLLWQGELMVSRRSGFQRYYDLTERVLPAGIDRTEPDPQELARHLVQRALRAYGISRERDIREMLRSSRLTDIRAALQEMQLEGSIAVVAAEGVGGENWYIPAATLQGLRLSKRRPRMRLLSPFDNLVILRDRLEKLFSYDYRIECYVPAPKRVFGYFSLPLLYGDDFAGRLDAKAHRDRGELEVRSLHLEEGTVADSNFVEELAARLNEFAAFNGCSSVKLSQGGRNTSAGLLRGLRRVLK